MSYSMAVLLDRPSLSLTYDTISAARSRPLADEDEVYMPSTIELNATVVVDAMRPLRLTALKARFTSSQILEDHEESQAGSVELYSKEITLIEGTPDGPNCILSAGRHHYTATFHIPSWLPPTFHSSASRVTHKVVAEVVQPSMMSYLPFQFKRSGKMAAQEVVLLREAPMTLNALRYWSGERRSAATSVAIKTTRFARINGRLKISMRVKSLEQLHSCKVDIVQDEACQVDMADDSPWHNLPDSSTSTGQATHLAFLAQGTKPTAYTKRKFPMPTITTAFPEPENLDPEESESSATLSTLSLEFPVVGNGLQAQYESPMLSITHKLRIRIRFFKPNVKEIVVNIPVTLFEGSASCDDIPPYYEEIYSDTLGRRRADSVATLPVYTAKEADTLAASSRCTSPTTHWLANDLHMQPPSITV